jgi:sporulation protein YlmC with PRC-barrel domain
MNKNSSHMTLAALALAAALGSSATAFAQVAGGTTTVDVAITESTQLALGWSVKKTLLGKTLYNDAGVQVGKVQDLIISPDKKLSYVIVGAGGFIGMGRNDVAIAVTQIQDKAGKLVMVGASKDMLKAMPEFSYATDTTQRDRFIAAADKDIALGKAKVSDLEKKSGAVATETKAKFDMQLTALKADLKSAEDKLTELKQATATRWREFEAGVGAATGRLRKAIDTA